MTPFRAPRRGTAVLMAGIVAVLVLGPTPGASASLGSVPAQVAAYVSDGGMIARLSDVYGKNAAGAGIDFDTTTKAGPISRVYEWTAARLRSAKTDHPVQLTNNWVVPVTIGERPVGLATLWINPQTVAPELADFTPTPALATAMAAVPATAALVRDTTTHAWFALADGTVTPLVAGTSGVSTPTAVESVKLSGGTAPLVAPGGPNTGLWLAIGAVGIVIVVILVALLIPRRRRAKPVPTPLVEPVETEPVETTPVAPAPRSRQARSAGTAGRSAGNAARSAESPARPTGARTTGEQPRSPVTKPAGSKPGSRASTSAAASAKPRTQKPPVQKPPIQKPQTPKPGQKPPPREPRPKPDPDPEV